MFKREKKSLTIFPDYKIIHDTDNKENTNIKKFKEKSHSNL